MKLSRTLLAGAFALVFSACTDNNSTMVDSGSGASADQPNSTGDTEDRRRGVAATVDTPVPAANTGMPAGSTSALADGDRKALMAVMEVDRHEIEAADAALSKNVQGEVRAYAETLRSEHTRNLEASRALLGNEDQTGREMTAVAGGTAMTTADAASSASSTPADLVEMKRKHDEERERRSALSGNEFQKAWVDAMAMGHQDALTKLDSELIPGATDARVKAHLQTTRSAIAAHLDAAKKLQQQAAN